MKSSLLLWNLTREKKTNMKKNYLLKSIYNQMLKCGEKTCAKNMPNYDKLYKTEIR